MKKTRLLCLCQLLCLALLSSCQRTAYIFMHPREEIMSVEIVEADYDASSGEASQQTLVAIKDKDSFLNKLEKIGYKNRLIGGPTGIDDRYIAVKISYKNGDYEVFDYGARSEYTSSEGYDVYLGFGSFSKEAFYGLLAEYLGYDATPD